MPDIDPPDADETYLDFMDRCTDDADEDTCQSIWDDAQDEKAGAGGIIRKTHATSKADGLDFVLSDETPDRYGDVLSADGWELSNFKKNPIALFNHNSSFPIGKWKGLNVENDALRGHLELAPAGTSERIDEIRKLVEAGILRAVSVGFLPVESRRARQQDSSPSSSTSSKSSSKPRSSRSRRIPTRSPSPSR